MTPSMKASAILLYLRSRYPITFMEVEEETITALIAGADPRIAYARKCMRSAIELIEKSIETEWVTYAAEAKQSLIAAVDALDS